MALHDGVLRGGEGHALCVLVGIGAGIGLAVGQSLQNRSPLGGGAVTAEQEGEGGTAAVGVHLGDEGAGFVDHGIIPCQGGYGADMAGEIRLAYLDLMPREHAGGVNFLFADKGIQQSAEKIGIHPRFLGGIEIPPHGGRLPCAVGLPQTARCLVQEAGQPYRHHVGLVAVGLQDGLGHAVSHKRKLQLRGKVARDQKLMAGAVMNQKIQSRDRFGHVGKGQTPEGDVDSHRILGGKSLGAGLWGVQTIEDEAQTLAADSVQSSCFLGHDPQPHAHGPLDSREADEVVLRDDTENGTEGLGGAAIAVLADGLAQALLELGGQQELAHELMEILTVGLHDAADKLDCDAPHAVFLGEDASDSLGYGGIPVIQSVGDLPIVVARGAPDHLVQIGVGLLGDVPRQHLGGIQIGHPLQGKATEHTDHHIGVGGGIRGAEGAAVVGDGVGDLPYVIRPVQDSFPVPLMEHGTEGGLHAGQDPLRELDLGIIECLGQGGADAGIVHVAHGREKIVEIVTHKPTVSLPFFAEHIRVLLGHSPAAGSLLGGEFSFIHKGCLLSLPHPSREEGEADKGEGGALGEGEGGVKLGQLLFSVKDTDQTVLHGLQSGGGGFGSVDLFVVVVDSEGKLTQSLHSRKLLVRERRGILRFLGSLTVGGDAGIHAGCDQLSQGVGLGGQHHGAGLDGSVEVGGIFQHDVNGHRSLLMRKNGWLGGTIGVFLVILCRLIKPAAQRKAWLLSVYRRTEHDNGVLLVIHRVGRAEAD